jgi:arylformamidase
MPVYDASAPLRPDLPSWPGDERFRRQVVSDLSTGDGDCVAANPERAHRNPCRCTVPFPPRRPGVEALPPDVLVGPAEVAGLEHLRGPITAGDLEASRLPNGLQRLLAKTANSGWSTRDTVFREDFIAFDSSAAQWCVDRGVRLLGIDYLSIEPFGSGRIDHPVHKILLGAGIAILEGLDLEGIDTGSYLLAALPLLIPGGDGAPARVVLSTKRLSGTNQA